ncbi:MAG: DoxX family protein [Pirellulales bacterium]
MQVTNVIGSIGLLILRVSFGLMMLIGHGWPKLAGFGEMADGFPDPLGMGGRLSMMAAIGAEVGCSILLVLGLGTRLAALPLAFTMVVALVMIHGSDPWQTRELAAVYLTVYATLFLTGGGIFSLDRLIWSRKKKSTIAAPAE